jgi:hypothetical protein
MIQILAVRPELRRHERLLPPNFAKKFGRLEKSKRTKYKELT